MKNSNEQDLKKIKAAVTYSKSVGGQSVISAKNVMKELGAEVFDADYREIQPVRDDLDEIYSNPNKRNEIFKEAKLKAEQFLADKDCLIISGNSAMIDPKLYGMERGTSKIDLARAVGELALLHVAIQKGMPVLGICGGHQLLNVYLNGNLGTLSSEDIVKQKFMDYSNVIIKSDSELNKIMNQTATNSEEQVIEKVFGAHTQYVKEVGGKGVISAGQERYENEQGGEVKFRDVKKII